MRTRRGSRATAAYARRSGAALTAVITSLLASACDVDMQGTDSGQSGRDGSGRDDASFVCTADEQCDDGAYCNGAETCDPSSSAAAPNGCVAGAARCMSGQVCSEAERRCVSENCEPPMDDADGDGFVSIDCGGSDCDDGDPQRYPGNTEICDVANVDEDCDPNTFGVRDADVDGEPDARCCNSSPTGDPICGTDCDDTRAGVSPTATETCDERDNDCDGMTDEGVLHTYYPDIDGDGFGDPTGTPVMSCFQPPMYSAMATDCDDTRGSVHPGLRELCDAAMLDEDCDGVANPETTCRCTDGDARDCPDPGACSGGRQSCVDGTWGACSIRPIAETCNGLDDDCDGTSDEGLTVTCYADADNDGYPAAGAGAMSRCPDAARTAVGGCPSFTTNRAPTMTDIDCADMSASRHPGAIEVCDATLVDDDCDGIPNNGCACANGDSRPCDQPGVCGTGTQICSGGAWGPCSISPSVEICNMLDDDCDETVDEGVTITCYADWDGDSYATSAAATSQACGVCPSMTTSRAPTTSSSTDCTEGDASVYPGATEICDGKDNNCNGIDDDLPGVTNYCRQGTGSRPCSDASCGGAGGSQNCVSCVWTECVRTGGRACSPGATSSCTSSTHTCSGSQTCSSTCTWGSCTWPSETCNYQDDDCDNPPAVDEGLSTTTCTGHYRPWSGGFGSGWTYNGDAYRNTTYDEAWLTNDGGSNRRGNAMLTAAATVSASVVINATFWTNSYNSTYIGEGLSLIVSDTRTGFGQYGLPSGASGYAFIVDFEADQLRVVRLSGVSTPTTIHSQPMSRPTCGDNPADYNTLTVQFTSGGYLAFQHVSRDDGFCDQILVSGSEVGPNLYGRSRYFGAGSSTDGVYRMEAHLFDFQVTRYSACWDCRPY